MWIKKTRRNRNPCIGESDLPLPTAHSAMQHGKSQHNKSQPNAATTAIASCNFRKGTVQCQGRSPAHVSVGESSAPEGSLTPCLRKADTSCSGLNCTHGPCGQCMAMQGFTGLGAMSWHIVEQCGKCIANVLQM
jgi:hypothetical protein